LLLLLRVCLLLKLLLRRHELLQPQLMLLLLLHRGVHSGRRTLHRQLASEDLLGELLLELRVELGKLGGRDARPGLHHLRV
jgi:hypothetical protein